MVRATWRDRGLHREQVETGSGRSPRIARSCSTFLVFDSCKAARSSHWGATGGRPTVYGGVAANGPVTGERGRSLWSEARDLILYRQLSAQGYANGGPKGGGTGSVSEVTFAGMG